MSQGEPITEGMSLLLSEKWVPSNTHTCCHHRYDLALTYTKFCLAPLGGGHGQRQIIVSFMGCIPVTIGGCRVEYCTSTDLDYY
jgi:hypothetical protein